MLFFSTMTFALPIKEVYEIFAHRDSLWPTLPEDHTLNKAYKKSDEHSTATLDCKFCAH